MTTSGRAQPPLETMAAEQTIPARFDAQVARSPDALAVRDAHRSLSYAQLGAEVDGIAQAVADASTTAEGTVALLAGHHAGAIAALMGVLKAGRTAVPLDPAHPASRNRAILSDARAEVVLCDPGHRALVDSLDTDGGSVVVEIGGLLSEAPRLGTRAVAGQSVASGAALLLYTSGSTGPPKAVVKTHRILLHSARNEIDTLQIGAHDRLSLLASLTTGAAMSHLLDALLSGASIHPYDVRKRGLARLATWLQGDEITLFHTVPSLFRQWAQRLEGRADLPALRVLRLGGEALHPSDLRLFRRRFPPTCTLVSSYGITELGSVSLCTLARDWTGGTPVGVPLDGVAVEIVDEEGAPAPEAELGEVVLASRFLSPGYWTGGAIDATRFEEPADGSDVRRFATGDLGRLHPDGELELLGRTDDRVKVRGQRVSLSEVEAAIAAHALVEDVAVVWQSERDRLLAYATAVGELPEAGGGTVSAWLRGRVPEAMVPTAVIFLEALPRLTGGKVDRAALLQRDDSRRDAGASYLAPRSQLERRLAAIWEDVLDVRPIGVRDPFFEVGGTSLSAAAMFSQVLVELGSDLPMGVLIEAPTIEALAARIQRAPETGAWGTIVPLRPTGSRPPLFIVPGLAVDVIKLKPLGDHFAGHLGGEQPLYALRQPGLDGRRAAPATIVGLASHYLRAIRRVQPTGPYFLAGSSFGGIIAYEMAAQLASGRPADVGLLVLLDTYAPGYPAARHRSSPADRVRRRLRRWLPIAGQLTAPLTPRSLRAGVRERLLLVVGHVSTAARRQVGRTAPVRHRYAYVALSSLRAKRRYDPPRYNGRVVLLRTEDEPVEGLFQADATLGWERYATGDIEIVPVPGRHGTHLREPNVGETARVLAELLQGAWP